MFISKLINSIKKYFKEKDIRDIEDLPFNNNDIIDTHKTFCDDKLYKEICDLSMGFIYVPKKRE